MTFAQGEMRKRLLFVLGRSRTDRGVSLVHGAMGGDRSILSPPNGFGEVLLEAVL